MILDRFLVSMVKKGLSFRGDGQPQLRYFTESDFGVSSTPFSFHSGKWKLNGKWFYVPGNEPKALIVFFHGLGAGYSAYTQEICALVKDGYCVYAYDNTGCMSSEGQGIHCLAQALLDQKAFFDYLDGVETTLPRYVVGHSWGGYAALGALDPSYHVAKAVSISGFISHVGMLLSEVKALGKLEGSLRKGLRRKYGVYGDLEMTDLLEKTDARVLYIQGEADPVVPKESNFDVLQRRFGGKPNIRLRLVPGAMHNPYWTLAAQKYLYELSHQTRAFYKDFDNSMRIDYGKLNQDDPKIIGEILSFLAE